MSALLGGGAPLRGRARLELVIRPFGFREAAEFWDVAHDPELAFRVHALAGGTPAYLEMCGGAGPRSVDGFDRWVQRRLLNPASAMFREGRLLLREEPSIAIRLRMPRRSPRSAPGPAAAQRSPPSSVARRARSGISSPGSRTSGSSSTSMSPARQATVFMIAEPIVRLYQLITSRYEPEIVAPPGQPGMGAKSPTVVSKIYGPHFEDLARQWCQRYADEETLGGAASAVRPTEIACREHQHGHELDIVVTEDSSPAAESPRSGRPRRPAPRSAPTSSGG